MSFLLLQKIHDCWLMREIWPYLTFKDISNLHTTNKHVRDIGRMMNQVVSQNIVLNLHYKSEKEEKRANSLGNMISLFPNISKLTFDQMNQSLQKLYSSQFICDSLRDLTVSIQSDEGVEGISNLKNIQNLNISCSYITILCLKLD